MASRHGPLVVLADVGEDRLAVGRRGVEQREVADAGEAHLEGAGDGRGVMREHVDVRAQLLDGLLVLDAEALLLVDDQQAEVLELDALDSRRWVPMTQSTSPRRRGRRRPPCACAGVRKRDSTSTRTG